MQQVTQTREQDMIKIIDLSYWKQNLNYQAIADKVDGAIIRGAYGKWKDTMFDQHMMGFVNQELPVGVFHFLVEFVSAQEQVDVMNGILDEVLDLGNGYGLVAGVALAMGLWMDVELENNAQALTRQTVDEYYNLIDGENNVEGFYSSRYYWDSIMKTDAYKHKKLWVAHYGAASPLLPATGGWNDWWLWQYSDREIIDGVAFDVNYFSGSADTFNEWVGGNVIDPQPEPEDDPVYKVEIVNCNALNVRKNPWTADNNILGQLSNGDKVWVYDVYSGWLKIEYGDGFGWIYSAYTQRIYETFIPIVTVPELTIEDKVEILWKAHPELH